MSAAINEGGDAGGIGEDGVPDFKGAIGSDNEGTAFIAPVDDLEEQSAAVAS